MKLANEIVFCTPEFRTNNPIGVVTYVLLKAGVIADNGKVQNLTALLKEREVTADYPFIGNLAHLVFIDKNKEPLFIASIVVYKKDYCNS